MATLSAVYSSGNGIYYNGLLVVDGQALGSFRFLTDHSLASGEYIEKTTIRTMYSNEWSITPDVEPMDATAVQSFYDAGPMLGAVIRTQWQQHFMFKPITYWYQIDAFLWALSGLGSDQSDFPPISSRISRIEDKQG